MKPAAAPRAYYNEHDPFAAAWLRELIKAGHIAPGDVDERSIEDVCPDDLAGYVQCHFFAGIGVWSHALRLAGWPDNRAIWTGSCPCQPFSAAGKGAGFDDERHLWPSFFDLIQQCNPPVVVGEQVASKDGLAWLDLVSADVEGSGRAFAAADLCAAGFGAPHIRQRSFWVAHGDYAQRRAGSAGGDDRHGADSRRAQGSGNTEGRRGAVRLADTGRGRLQPERGSGRPRGAPAGSVGEGDQRERLRPYDRFSLPACGLADAASDGRGESGSDGRGLRQGDSPEGRPAGSLSGSAANRVGDPSRPRAKAGLSEPVERQGRDAEVDGDGRDRLLRSGEGRPAHGIGHNGAPSTNGFWFDADWLGCRDGKWRPVEPGTFPLAHGAANRVGRLRGYGNAIVGPVAQGFIEAVMECQS